ncbi:hypothetical protein ACPJHQ_15835 [Rossellomorea sp. H39__3]
MNQLVIGQITRDTPAVPVAAAPLLNGSEQVRILYGRLTLR